MLKTKMFVTASSAAAPMTDHKERPEKRGRATVLCKCATYIVKEAISRDPDSAGGLLLMSVGEHPRAKVTTPWQ